MTPFETEGPYAIQLFGSEPEILAEGAKIACEYANPDMIDLNMGGFLKCGWTQEFTEASSQPEKTGQSSLWRGFHATCRKYSPRGKSTQGYSAAFLMNRVHSCSCCFKGMPIHIYWKILYSV